MVFTDGVHMVANTVEELHEFAESIGLKRHFFHGVRKGHPHYDLTNERIRKIAWEFLRHKFGYYKYNLYIYGLIVKNIKL